MDLILKRNLTILAIFTTITVCGAAAYSNNKKNNDTSAEIVTEEANTTDISRHTEKKSESSFELTEDLQITDEIPMEFADLDFSEDPEIKKSWSNYSSDAKKYVSTLDNGLSNVQNYYLLQYAFEQSQKAGQVFNSFAEFMASDEMKTFNKTIKDSLKNSASQDVAQNAAKDYAQAFWNKNSEKIKNEAKEAAKEYWDENGDRIKNEAQEAVKEAAKEYWDENGDQIKAEAKEQGEQWMEEHKDEIIDAATDKIAEEAKDFLENNKDEIIKGIISQMK